MIRRLLTALAVVFAAAYTAPVLFAQGIRDTGGVGVLKIGGKGVNSVRLQDATLTEVQTSRSDSTTESSYVYANTRPLELNISWIDTDLEVIVECTRKTGSRSIAVFSDGCSHALTSIRRGDTAMKLSGLPRKSLFGQMLEGFYVSPGCEDGTRVFNADLSVVRNVSVNWIRKSDPFTTYTELTTYTDADGWAYEGNRLTVYARWVP